MSLNLVERIEDLKNSILDFIPKNGQMLLVLKNQINTIKKYEVDWEILKSTLKVLYEEHKIYPKINPSGALTQRVYKNQ